MLLIQPHWLLVELGFFFTLLMMGLPLPAISSLAMESEREYAGAASALLGFAPFFLGGIVSPLVGIGDIFYACAIVMLLCAIIGFGLYWSVKDQIKNET